MKVNTGRTWWCTTAAVAFAATSLLATAPSATAVDRGVSVTPNPIQLASGNSATFVAQLSGATATEVERGIGWVASEPVLEVTPGWQVSGLDGKASVKLTRDLGDHAEFTFTSTLNGHWSFTLLAQDAPSGTPLANAIDVTVDASSPDLINLPKPPANVRIETQGLVVPVPATKAYFQARVASDGFALPYVDDGVGYAPWAKITVSGPFGLQSTTGTQGTPFIDVTAVWVTTKKPDATVRLKYYFPGLGTITYQNEAVPTGLAFAAATVLEVYPPATMLRCSDYAARLTCQVALANAGWSTHAMAVTPAAVPVTIQVRSSDGQTWGKWSAPRTVSADVNPSLTSPIIVLGPSGPRSRVHQVRTLVPGSPQSTVVVTAKRISPAELLPWTVSNRDLLKAPRP